MQVHDANNHTTEDMNKQGTVLEALVTTMRTNMDELKAELVVVKACEVGGFAVGNFIT